MTNTDQDRTTYILRDVEGHALETEQLLTSLNSGEKATGWTGNTEQYDAYDADGNLVKQFQIADSTDTLVTFYEYDALGRQTDVISPETLSGTINVSDQYTRYNAFGEVTGKGTSAYTQGGNPPVTKVYTQLFYYDNAGRIFLSNTGEGGAYQAYLYDLAGNSTGKITDQWTAPVGGTGTSWNLSALSAQGSAQNAYTEYTSGSGSLTLTQTLYDAMGNVVEQRLPKYTVLDAAEPMSNSGVQVQTIGNATYLTWYGPADSTLQATLLINGTARTYTTLVGAGNESGYEAGFNITGMANGTYSYEIDYSRPGDATPVGVATGSLTVNNTVSLQIGANNGGTVSSVAASIISGNNILFSWTADSTQDAGKLGLLIAGTWHYYSGGMGEGGVMTVELPESALTTGTGTYQYCITDTFNGMTEAEASGTLSYTAPTTGTTTTGSATPAAVWYSPGTVSASASVGTQGSGTVTSTATPVQTPIKNESGQITGYTDSWAGTDSVNLTWLDLASGTYTVVLHYNTAANSTYGISSVAASKSFTIGGGDSGSFSWGDPTQTNSFAAGGISSISYFQILQGGTVVRDSRNGGVTSTTISWSPPRTPATAERCRFA